MSKIIRFALLSCAVLVFGAATARADSIGPTCSTCQGSIYTLDNLGLVTDLYTADNSFDTYRIMLTIDTSGYTGPGERIDEVAVKIASSNNAATIVSGPPEGVWNLVPGGLNSGGCSGSGAGFECSDWVSGVGARVHNGLLSWVFDIDVASGLLTGTNQASIKARYVDQYDVKVGALVSEAITLGPPTTVPEPGTLALLGMGIAVAFAGRRRFSV